jgi:hypothetical protein
MAQMPEIKKRVPMEWCQKRFQNEKISRKILLMQPKVDAKWKP